MKELSEPPKSPVANKLVNLKSKDPESETNHSLSYNTVLI